MAQATSFLIGLLFLLWGIIILSNQFYLLSCYTHIQNFIFGEKRIDDRINVLHVDTESYLIMSELYDDKLDIEYHLFAEAIDVLTQLAKQTNESVIAGIDMVYLRKPMPDKNREGYELLIEKLASIPDNLYIIFGGEIDQRQDGFFYLRTDIIDDLVMKALEKRNLNKKLSIEEQKKFRNQFYIGYLRLGLATVKSGKNKEFFKTASGYLPGFRPSDKIPMLFFSLPYSMFLVGEIISENNRFIEEIKCDKLSGSWEIPQDLRDNFFKINSEKIKIKDIQNFLSSFIYYNFENSKDIKDLGEQYYRLYDHSEEINEWANPVKYNNQKYFFLTKGIYPDYLDTTQSDRIVSPAFRKNYLTDEIKSVSGVMAPIMALNNLLNKTYVQKLHFLFHIILIIFLSIALIYIFWNFDLLYSIITLFSAIFIIFLISLSLFLFLRVLFPFQIEGIFCVAYFSIITLLRIKVTTKKDIEIQN